MHSKKLKKKFTHFKEQTGKKGKKRQGKEMQKIKTEENRLKNREKRNKKKENFKRKEKRMIVFGYHVKL